MLDAMATGFRWNPQPPLQIPQFSIEIQNLPVGPVPDGVDGQPETRGGGPPGRLPHGVRGCERDAQVLRLSLIRRQHPCGPRPQGAVREDFHRPYTQPGIPETGSQTEGQGLVQHR